MPGIVLIGNAVGYTNPEILKITLFVEDRDSTLVLKDKGLYILVLLVPLF
ncbi:hypothetical protein GCM10007354_03690 [Acinetobacter courvalinii]|uniref:Uncharacterized protein n=1 Tax=Acinetobacter courvalinii TaxID=280147 RepID=A0ABD0A399_9GAMM|nr:hypothetical protein GCM10007354_03690 [Acinetobacter courvalinii]